MRNSMHSRVLIVSALAGLVFAVGSMVASAQIRKGTVAAQSLAVYAAMSKDDDPVATLQHGTAVQVLFSVTTGDGSWCTVANADSSTKLGYVDCTGLAIETTPHSAASASGMAVPGSPPTPEQKAWALAASAIAATSNAEGTSMLAADTPARAKEILALGWGVHSRVDLFNALDQLEEGKERAMFVRLGKSLSALSDADFDKLMSRASPLQATAAKVAREYYPRYQIQTLIGWDYARYINVCRWGVSAGYMTAEEAWPRIMNAARTLQRYFGSWEELGQNYIVGRKFVVPTTVGIPAVNPQTAYTWLTSNPASPWQKIPWNLPLN
jgi:hypothetical protein